MDLQLKNKIVLITGASKGLGYETARLLSQEGAIVNINSREKERIDSAAKSISQQTNNPVFAYPGNVSDHDFADQLVQNVSKRFDRIDILITNSGGPPSGKFEDFSDDQWQQAVELSFLSHMRLIRASLPYLRKSSFPTVLTVTSYSVKQPIENLVLSNSIRAATVGLTKTLALELGQEGIRFNSILPGWTKTDRVSSLLQSRAEIRGTSLEEESNRQSADSPFGRMATPEEFAYAAAFLVSPRASYLTGVMLPVDGGMYKGLF